MIFAGPSSTSTVAEWALIIITNANLSDVEPTPTTSYFAEYEPPDTHVELQKWTQVVEATLEQSVIVYNQRSLDHYPDTDRAGYEHCNNITKFDSQVLKKILNKDVIK